ncbi:MAG: exosortase/archaeosortase family protein [Deltaproteobacteria bacterium]|nr:exosortase/archaeosortase family protein [Deltaproteobacteria bacterium]
MRESPGDKHHGEQGVSRSWFIFGFLFLFLFFAYYPIIYDLRDSVIGNELARHAPLVFALSGFLVYQKRKILWELLKSPCPDAGSPVFFLVGLSLNLLGQASGVYFLAQLSIPLTLYGLACYLKGVSFARQFVFPLALLGLAFPIPGKIYMDVVFPLKLLVTKAAAALLTLMGYQVKIYGNIIEISSLFLGVADACSGLNSLMAILTLSIFYSYLVIRRWKFRLAIVISMLPLIIMVNIIRVTTTAVVAVKWGPEMAEGKLHSLWGIAVFVVAVLGLMAITKFFMVMESRISHDLHENPSIPPLSRGGKGEFSCFVVAAPGMGVNKGKLFLVFVLLLMSGLLSAYLQNRGEGAQTASLPLSLPMVASGWQGSTFSAVMPWEVGPDDFILRQYRQKNGPSLNFLALYSRISNYHPPALCYQGSGRELTEIPPLKSSSGKIRLAGLMGKMGQETILVYHGFYVGGKVIPDGIEKKIYEAGEKLKRGHIKQYFVEITMNEDTVDIKQSGVYMKQFLDDMETYLINPNS